MDNNSTNDNLFTYIINERSNDVDVLNNGDIKVQLKFSTSNVKIKDSHKLNLTEIKAVVKYIRKYCNNKNISITRKDKELCGEIILHKWLYKIGYKRINTKDCDLDFMSDKRWYVNILSKLIGLFISI